jgi:hypothetical protein
VRCGLGTSSPRSRAQHQVDNRQARLVTLHRFPKLTNPTVPKTAALLHSDLRVSYRTFVADDVRRFIEETLRLGPPTSPPIHLPCPQELAGVTTLLSQAAYLD